MLYVLEPVFSGRGAPAYTGEDEYDEGAARRRVALTALRDLEYDRITGKLDGKDYELLKGELSRDALRQLDPGPEGAAGAPVVDRASREIEEEIAQLRDALREGRQCDRCEHVNRSGARYCGHCGKVLGSAPGLPEEGTAAVTGSEGQR